MRVESIPKVAMNEQASKACARGTIHLHEKGWHRYAWSWDHAAVAAFRDDGTCAGVILYKLDDDLKELDISFAWCEPDAPTAFASMLTRVRAIAKEKEMRAVTWGCHSENGPMLKAAKAVQAKHTHNSYRLDI